MPGFGKGSLTFAAGKASFFSVIPGYFSHPYGLEGNRQMQSFFSSAPLPSGGASPAPARVPGPTIVPRTSPPKRGLSISGILLIAVILGAGAAWYWNSRRPAKDTTGGGITATLPTMVVGMGDLQSTIRIAGTVAAERYASIMAPRIQGNRGNYNRGGQGGNGGNGNNNDFNLLITKLAEPGSWVQPGDLVAEFDTEAQRTRLDDYKDSVVQLEANINRLKANLAASKESLAQQVRSAKANWDKAVLDLQTAPIRAAIDAEKFKIAVDEAKETYTELVKQAQLQDVSQTAQIKASEFDRDQSRIELQRAQ